MSHPPQPQTPRPCAPYLCLLACLSLGLGCSGGRGGPTVSTPPSINPPAPTVVAGQTLQFTCSAPPGTTVLWSVVPQSGGTISTTGLFQAVGAVGSFYVTAKWQAPQPVTATARLTVLPLGPPAVATADQTEADGLTQATPDGLLTNVCVLGEGEAIIVSGNADQSLENSTGFYPLVPPGP